MCSCESRQTPMVPPRLAKGSSYRRVVLVARCVRSRKPRNFCLPGGFTENFPFAPKDAL
jgi:hypothetical protein